MKRNSDKGKTAGTARGAGIAARNKTKLDYGFLFWTLVGTILSVGAASYLLNTPDLVVTDVEVKGVCYAGEDVVQGLAESAVGNNLLALPKGAIARQIAAVSEVRNVKIGRTFPNSVWVRVEERTPFASLVTPDGYALLQEDGFAFHVSPTPAPGSCVIKLTKPPCVAVGSTPEDARLSCALDLLRRAKQEDVAPRRILIDQDGDMCLNMSSGFLVKLGQPDEVPRKLSLLRRALDYRPSLASEAAYIDVSCPGAMVWRPKRGAS